MLLLCKSFMTIPRIELFLKLDKYEYQNEYRLVWFSNEEIKNSIIVRCPEAVLSLPENENKRRMLFRFGFWPLLSLQLMRA